MEKERLRAANYGDRELLFHWVNDRSVRAVSFQTEEITWETHVAWFEKMMADTDTMQFIYEYEGMPVGQVRLNVQNGKGVISYSIAANFRGTGKAQRMLALLEKMIKSEYPDIHELDAEVKSENIASRRAFENMNYQENVILYKKIL